MDKIRYNRLTEIVSNYDVLFSENKIINNTTCRRNGRLSSNGRYIAVNIQYNGKSYTYSLHEIVAYKMGEMLIGKEINHKDGNRFNNKPDNLEVIAPSENKNHQKNNALLSHVRGIKNGSSKLDRGSVKMIKEIYSTVKNYTEIGTMFGVGRNTVKDIISGKTWRHIA